MNMQEVVEEAGNSRILQGASVCPKTNRRNDGRKSDIDTTRGMTLDDV